MDGAMLQTAARSAPTGSSSCLVADMSLALINRTGAYHVCREIAESCDDLLSARRYWRRRGNLPTNRNLRRVLARLMLLEIAHPAISRFLPPRRVGEETILYMDPLYVMGEIPRPSDVVLCHDMGPVTHPELFGADTETSYRRAFKLIRVGRPGMVFVSEASRDAFIRHCGSDFRFLEVIPLFVRSKLPGSDEAPPPGIKRPFLLTVGALERRKNYIRTMEAFQALGLADKGYTYVFCGPAGNAAAEIGEAARRTRGVVQLGYVSDAELRWLYRNATGFVLVSLLEGFGMPALEAAQNGLVSLIGDGGAQREAVGEGAIIADACSVDAIAIGMHRLVEMPAEERKARVQLVRRHAANLTRERFVGAWRTLLAGQ